MRTPTLVLLTLVLLSTGALRAQERRAPAEALPEEDVRKMQLLRAMVEANYALAMTRSEEHGDLEAARQPLEAAVHALVPELEHENADQFVQSLLKPGEPGDLHAGGAVPVSIPCAAGWRVC